MKWKFWKKEETTDLPETIIKVTKGISNTKEIYVSTKGTDEAFKLYKKVQKQSD